MDHDTSSKVITLTSSKEDCEQLADIFEGIRQKFNASERADKMYIMTYMRFKELVRYFTSKEDGNVQAVLKIDPTDKLITYSLTVYNCQGDEIATCIFSSY